LEKENLWNNLRERGRRFKVNIIRAEKELDEVGGIGCKRRVRW